MPSHCLRRDICTICRCCSSKQNTQWVELIFEIMEHSVFLLHQDIFNHTISMPWLYQNWWSWKQSFIKIQLQKIFHRIATIIQILNRYLVKTKTYENWSIILQKLYHPFVVNTCLCQTIWRGLSPHLDNGAGWGSAAPVLYTVGL